jgi:hypothetical protein
MRIWGVVFAAVTVVVALLKSEAQAVAEEAQVWPAGREPHLRTSWNVMHMKSLELYFWHSLTISRDIWFHIIGQPSPPLPSQQNFLYLDKKSEDR